jgi:hypothetical protein
MKRASLLFLVAACGPKPVVVPANDTPQPPPAAPIGPGPKVHWAHGQFTTDGLPAMSKDGSKFVYAYSADDGGRGAPNLSVIAKDSTDTQVNELVVLRAGDADAPDPAKIDDANRYLAGGYASFDYETLQPAAIDDTGEDASFGGVSIHFDDTGHLVVKDGDTVLAERDEPDWLVKDTPMGETGEMCHNPAFLADAWVEVQRGAAVLHVAYRGTDSCWEPDSTMHVIVWK